MRTIIQSIKTIVFVSGAVLIAVGNPLMAYADDAPAATTAPVTTVSTPTPDGTTTTPPASSQPPVPSTTAPSDTTTTTSAPTPPKTTYTYDTATGHWDSNKWSYDPTSGKYQPAPAPIETPSVTVPSSSTSTPSTAQTVISSTTTNAIANAINSTATSGDASILNNTSAGSATTGNASSAATIINNVNSSLTNSANQQAASFVTNVMGDVNGDILLQPMLLKAMLEANAASSTATTLNSSTNTSATNNITLAANSGNSTVSGNTNAGNATTGTANTVANVVNIVNSMVAANQSFVGTVNIYGNLNGDILVAPDFIPQLLASNGDASSPSPVGTASITSNDTQSVVNNIALAAQTGQSLVSNNTTAGSATTGNANTNAVIFNLTGHAIVASNSLLVFVNVLGSWVGVIVDAPAGATAAAIGSGVTSNSVTPNLVINAADSTQLTNNINLSSQSGNATITDNTNAGNATTGDATASANIANLSNDEISTTGWFGILFINVFGNWYGSFGINTAAGNPIGPLTTPTQEAVIPGNKTTPTQVMEFIPHTRQTSTSVIQGGNVQSSTSASPDALLTTETATPGRSATTPSKISAPQSQAPIDAFGWPLFLGSLAVIGGSLFGLRKLSS